MERADFYKKLLEAQIRGMMVGTYDTHNNLTADERATFFAETIEKGFFCKSDGTGASYTSFDEMLEDLVNGKEVINLKTPHAEAGCFSFPANVNELYEQFNRQNGPEQTGLSFSTSFGQQREKIINSRNNLAAGEEPPVPGGFFSSLWNNIVKVFTGHSSEAWAKYDKYQEEKALRDTIAARENEYAARNKNTKPGTVEDEFTEKLLNVDRNGRIARHELVVEEPESRNEPDQNGSVSEEQARIDRVQQQLSAQELREMAERNRKLEEIRELDINTYRAFTEGYSRHKTIDEALAAATKHFEALNLEGLNMRASREIDELHDSMLGTDRAREYVYGMRNPETSRLIADNAYYIQKFLKANSVNPEFHAKVDAEFRALKDRCDARGMEDIYFNHEAFNKSEIEIKMALQELKIEGAEQYKTIAETDFEMREKSAKVVPEEPKTDIDIAEENFAAGTATEVELNMLLQREDTIRDEINMREEKPAGLGNHELYQSIEFDLDLEMAGMKTGDPVQDKALTLKMMRAQHEAINNNQEIPFFFTNDEEKLQSRRQALEHGFISQKQFNADSMAIESDEPELDIVDEQAIDEEKILDKEIASHAEEERLQAEQAQKAEMEQELGQKARDKFLHDAAYDESRSVVFAEYNRLRDMAQKMQKSNNEDIQDLGEYALDSLSRALDVRSGLDKYDEELAAIDLATIVTMTECERDPKFRENFKANPDVLNDIAFSLKHLGITDGLLKDKPTVDALFFKKNKSLDGANLSTADIYKGVLKLQARNQQVRAENSEKKTMLDYSNEQKALLGNSEKMNAIMSNLTQGQLSYNMTKEEVLLQNDATVAMSSIYADVLMKPQSAGSVDAEALTENLTTVAMYQSLRNPAYREANNTLTGYSKLKDMDKSLCSAMGSKYRDMIREQVKASGIVSKICADRTAIAELAFSDSGDLFTGISKINLAKNVSFASQTKAAMSEITQREQQLKAALKESSKSLGEAEAAGRFKPAFDITKIEKAIMEDVGKSFISGTRELQENIAAQAKKPQRGNTI